MAAAWWSGCPVLDSCHEAADANAEPSGFGLELIALLRNTETRSSMSEAAEDADAVSSRRRVARNRLCDERRGVPRCGDAVRLSVRRVRARGAPRPLTDDVYTADIENRQGGAGRCVSRTGAGGVLTKPPTSQRPADCHSISLPGFFSLSAERGTPMIRTCKQCGETFDLDYRWGRPRERCFSCQPPGMRAISSPGGARKVWRSDPAPPSFMEAFERSVRARGAERSVEGTLVLRLAERFAAGGETAAGVAALSRVLRNAMVELDRSWPAP